MRKAVRIGLDFDNTIICYDAVFTQAAIQRGLLPQGFRGNKQFVRDEIRRRPEGDLAWQGLQGYVYGKGIVGAHPFAGVDGFLRRAQAAGAQVSIVSHKTEHGHFDPDRINLRTAALGWMEAQKFFADDGFAIDRRNIHFAATRAEKIARIAALGCETFIDDLEEVFVDPLFPTDVTKILFSESACPDQTPYRVCRTWQAIEQAVFE
jgi:hypothetical protein